MCSYSRAEQRNPQRGAPFRQSSCRDFFPSSPGLPLSTSGLRIIQHLHIKSLLGKLRMAGLTEQSLMKGSILKKSGGNYES